MEVRITSTLSAAEQLVTMAAGVAATAGQIYLGNACAHCGALQGDLFLRKPDAPFFPMTEEAADALAVAWHSVALQAVADCGYSSWIDGLLERRGDYAVPKPARQRGRGGIQRKRADQADKLSPITSVHKKSAPAGALFRVQ